MEAIRDQFPNLSGEIKTLANTMWNSWIKKNAKAPAELRSSLYLILRAKEENRRVAPNIENIYIEAEQQLNNDMSPEEASFILEALVKNDHDAPPKK